MAESDQHRDLVKDMAQNLKARFPDMSVLIDIPAVPGEGMSPPIIKGSKPDVHGECIDTKIHAICEAKTYRDLSSRRTVKQLDTFIEYLASKPHSLFILGVYGFELSEKAQGILQLRYTHIKTCILQVYNGFDFWEFRHEGGQAWHLL